MILLFGGSLKYNMSIHNNKVNSCVFILTSGYSMGLVFGHHVHIEDTISCVLEY